MIKSSAVFFKQCRKELIQCKKRKQTKHCDWSMIKETYRWSLKNLLVLIYSKLHSKSCDYLYIYHCKIIVLGRNRNTVKLSILLCNCLKTKLLNCVGDEEKEEMRNKMRDELLAQMEFNNQNMMSWDEKVECVFFFKYYCFKIHCIFLLLCENVGKREKKRLGGKWRRKKA